MPGINQVISLLKPQRHINQITNNLYRKISESSGMKKKWFSDLYKCTFYISAADTAILNHCKG